MVYFNSLASAVHLYETTNLPRPMNGPSIVLEKPIYKTDGKDEEDLVNVDKPTILDRSVDY